VIGAIVPIAISVAKLVWALAPIARKIHAARQLDSEGGRDITPAEWREILGGSEAAEALDNVNGLGRRARKINAARRKAAKAAKKAKKRGGK
tara:strand:+ start:165 stop:440 length:276 start_codon:yes stop_codon:yes gene_type:complete